MSTPTSLKREDRVTKVNRTTRSVRRLIRLFLSIRETPFTYHQTLTFGQDVQTSKQAKGYLEKLLGLLQKQFPSMATVYVEEPQQRGTPHYHVRFYFFNERDLPFSPSDMERKLRAEVYKRWADLRGDAVARRANPLKRSKMNKAESLHYLLKDVMPVTSKARGEVTWYGTRRNDLLKDNSTPISDDDLNQFFIKRFWKPNRQPGKRLMMKDLQWDRAYLQLTIEQWEKHKQRETGSKEPVSDSDFLGFVNERRSNRKRVRRGKGKFDDPSLL